MRLFEFAPTGIDLGVVRTALATYVKKANEKRMDIKIPYMQLLSLIDQDDLPLGGPDSDKQGLLTALKNNPKVDPTGDVFDVEGDYIIIKSQTKAQQDQVKGGGKGIDQMASSAASKEISGGSSVNQMASSAAKTIN